MVKALILGGARSGKSAYAEMLAGGLARPVLYVATGAPEDDEMRARIAHHVQRRNPEWQTLEEGMNLGPILQDARWRGHVILVDCLTLWISNILNDNGGNMEQRRGELAEAVRGSEAHILLVSNEVGLGIVPAHPLARRFRDEAGWTHQALAEICDRVVFMAAGLPMLLKS